MRAASYAISGLVHPADNWARAASTPQPECKCGVNDKVLFEAQGRSGRQKAVDLEDVRGGIVAAKGCREGAFTMHKIAPTHTLPTCAHSAQSASQVPPACCPLRPADQIPSVCAAGIV